MSVRSPCYPDTPPTEPPPPSLPIEGGGDLIHDAHLWRALVLAPVGARQVLLMKSQTTGRGWGSVRDTPICQPTSLVNPVGISIILPQTRIRE